MRQIQLLSLILALIAASSSAVFAQLEEEVQVNLMEIWVKVTDDSGKAIRDLDPSEFQVLVDGKELPFQCFDSTFQREHRADAENGADAEKAHGNKYIFYFDLLNSMPGDLDYLKGKMSDFLATSFHENDQAMAFALMPSMHLGVVQKWTSDRTTLISIIEKMHGNMTLRASLVNNERLLLDLLYPADTSQASNPGQDRGVGTRPVDGLQQAKLLARNLAAQDASRSRLTLNSFLTIASYLSGFALEDRPVVIYISGGFPMYPGLHYLELVQKALDERFELGPGDLSILERPSSDFQNEVRNAMGRLNRLNVTIYSLDTKGLLTASRGAERDGASIRQGLDLLAENRQLQDSLVFLARETGGTAFINSQDYSRGFHDIVRDLNEQYWMCVNLPPTTQRNKYHKIEVKVNRPGTHVRHRQGYIE